MKYVFGMPKKRRWPLFAAAGGLVAGAVTVAILLWVVPHSPVPASVKQAVNFPVYYPEQQKLPSGYKLDTASFTASDQVVMYAITYESNKKLLVTVQKRPNDDEIANFYKNTIPINRKVLTLNGEAAIGAIESQAIASLPTNDLSWIIIMAPADINKDEFSRVLQAIKKTE